MVYALALLQEAGNNDLPADRFVGTNVSISQYEGWSPEERFQYLDAAKQNNQAWIQKRLHEMRAAWLMVVDSKVVAHGPTIQQLPQESAFAALCERHGKYPFVFFNPRLFLIKESVKWHHTIEPDDDYPTSDCGGENARSSRRVRVGCGFGHRCD